VTTQIIGVLSDEQIAELPTSEFLCWQLSGYVRGLKTVSPPIKSVVARLLLEFGNRLAADKDANYREGKAR
jgi:hypothetical protein